jgi:predicted PurR-regulated permease PerM
MRAAGRIHWGRLAFYTVVALLALWLAWAGRGIWFPVFLALVIAMVLDPTVDRLENRGLPRAAATGLVFLLFFAALVAAVFLLSPVLSQQAARISQDLGNLFPDPERPNLVPVTQKILARMEAHPALRDALVEAARAGTTRLQETLNRGSELALAWAPHLVWFIVVPVLSFYLLNDFHRFYAKGILLVKPEHRPFAQNLVAEVSSVFGKYLRGLAFLCLLLGCSIAALLYVFGNPYWQLLGLIGGLLYAVPAVGSLFFLGLVVLVTLVSPDPGKAVWVGLSLVLLTNGLFDQIVTPRVLGKQVGLHPVLTILALLLGYEVAGIVGMLVAVPLAASVQTVIVLLVPKLGADMELKPLTELQQAEAETREEHLEAEEKPLDEHLCLHTVVENVEEAQEENGAAPQAA